MGSLVGDLVRSIRGATTNPPVPYAPAGRYGLKTQVLLGGNNSREMLMRAMSVNPTVYAVVDVITRAVAKPQWKLYRKNPVDGRVRYTTSDEGPDNRTEVIQHQALKVWNSPNPFYTNTQFIRAQQQHRELAGEAYWLIDYGTGTIPLGLWPVRPDRMEPIPGTDSFLAGYIYTGPDGQQIPFKPAEVIMLKDPDPRDPYHGLGPVQSVLVDIDADTYASNYNRNFFLNGAQPGGMITTPNELSDGEFDQLVNQFRETHQGVSRAHRVGVLENGATWTPHAITQRDMDFANLRTVSRDMTKLAWGVHSHILGISEDVNRANAITAEEIFQDSKVVPRLDDIKDVLNNQFLALFGSTGEGVEFDYIDPRPVNREADAKELISKAQAALFLVQGGYTPESAAYVVGLGGLEAGMTPKEQNDNPGLDPAGDGVTADQLDRMRTALMNRARMGALL
jgi:HK97 family phage portal protein